MANPTVLRPRYFPAVAALQELCSAGPVGDIVGPAEACEAAGKALGGGFCQWPMGTLGDGKTTAGFSDHSCMCQPTPPQEKIDVEAAKKGGWWPF